MEYEYPETIWAVALDTVALERVICSPLDHGEECPRYVRADIAEAVVDAIRKVRDGYADQARFADIDCAVHFREVVRRVDAALAAS